MKRFCLAAFALLCAGVLVGAQEAPPPPPPPHVFAGARLPGMRPGKVVTGQPYSADFTSTVDQTLSDGNTIHRVMQGHLARDGQGRTYARQQGFGGPWAQKGSTTMIFVTDPVAGYAYVINESTKTAIRRVLRQRPENGAVPPPEGPGPRADNSNRVEKDLGTQSFSGIECTGKSITRTLPAGAVGNAQPIVDKAEVWTAPDLQVVVYSKRTDPRMGQSTYLLSNIQRGEPDASLFQVPAGYTVEDAPSRR